MSTTRSSSRFLTRLATYVFAITSVVVLVHRRRPVPNTVKAFPIISFHPSTSIPNPRFRSLVQLRGETNGESDDNTNEGSGSSNDPLDVESARKQLESLLSMTTGDNQQPNGQDIIDENSMTDNHPTSFSIRDFLQALPPPPSDKLDSITLPLPPPMSTMERKRREDEIKLLERLKDSDDAAPVLWDLWYNERGVQCKEYLSRTDQLMSNPQRWDECEALLVQLIDGIRPNDSDNNKDRQRSSSSSSDSSSRSTSAEGNKERSDDLIDRRPGIYFVEAVNRLATLYFLQQRLDDSYKLCRIILQLKPWHFGALSGIVQVCIALGNRDEARTWAERRLPNIVSGSSFPGAPIDSRSGPMNPRRAEWCKKAVANAKELLLLAEKNTQQSLGQPENYYLDQAKSSRRSGIDTDVNDDKNDDETAWQ